MSRSVPLILVLLSGASVPTHAKPAALNVLLLAVDGLDTALTPAMASLAERGRRFERAYLPHPLAGPSRVALFLGRRPERIGAWGEPEGRPAGDRFLHELFSEAGYRTARVGRAVGGKLDPKLQWDVAAAPS